MAEGITNKFIFVLCKRCQGTETNTVCLDYKSGALLAYHAPRLRHHSVQYNEILEWHRQVLDKNSKKKKIYILFIIFVRHVTNKMATHFWKGIIFKPNVKSKEVYPNLPDKKILVQVRFNISVVIKSTPSQMEQMDGIQFC